MSSIKDILVLCTGGELDDARVACSAYLAEQQKAYVTLVLANELPPLPIASVGPEGYISELDEGLRRDALAKGAEREAALEKRFSDRLPQLGIVRANARAPMMGDEIAVIARRYDLFVCSLPGAEGKGAILDAVLDQGGRAVLALPREAQQPVSLDHVTIAWNGSREATRAIAEAMPLLRQAKEVAVLLIDQPQRQAGEERSVGDNIVRHLSRHDVSATVVRVASNDLGVSEAIIAETRRLGSKLLVMGAHKEGGVLQWFKEQVSRNILAASTIPLLMAR